MDSELDESNLEFFRNLSAAMEYFRRDNSNNSVGMASSCVNSTFSSPDQTMNQRFAVSPTMNQRLPTYPIINQRSPVSSTMNERFPARNRPMNSLFNSSNSNTNSPNTTSPSDSYNMNSSLESTSPLPVFVGPLRATNSVFNTANSLFSTDADNRQEPTASISQPNMNAIEYYRSNSISPAVEDDRSIVSSSGGSMETLTPHCHGCKEIVKVFWECYTCRMSCCARCISDHGKLKHSTSLYNNCSPVPTSFDMPSNNFVSRTYCAPHMQFMNFFCKTCRTEICKFCIFRDHRNHHIASEEEFGRMMEQKNKMALLRKFYQEFSERATQTQNVITACDSNLINGRHEIVYFTEKLKDMIDQYAQVCIKQLTDNNRQELMVLNQKNIFYKTWIQRYQNVMTNLETSDRFPDTELSSLESLIKDGESYKITPYSVHRFFGYSVEHMRNALPRVFGEVKLFVVYPFRHFYENSKPRPIYNIGRRVVIKRPTTNPVFFGSDEGQPGHLTRAYGVCCDRYNNYYVTDRTDNCVYVYDRDLKYRFRFGSGGTDLGEFNHPSGICIDPHGRIIIADKDNHRIQVFTENFEFIFAFGKQGSDVGEFKYPWEVAVNHKREILVSDSRNHRLQLFNCEGRIIRVIGPELSIRDLKIDQPRGVCFTPLGHILMTDFNNHRLILIHYETLQAQTYGCLGKGLGEFSRPQGVACDDEGNIVVADSRNCCIKMYSSDMRPLWKEGYGPGPTVDALDRPSGLCLNADGNVVLVDYTKNRVAIFK